MDHKPCPTSELAAPPAFGTYFALDSQFCGKYLHNVHEQNPFA